MAAALLGPGWPWSIRVAGIALAASGAALFAASARALGGALTPLPKPRYSAHLVEHGPYRLVRHPICGSGMLAFLGYGLATSVPALALAALLVPFWTLKAAVEERWLEERLAAYSDYRRRTPRRFVPWFV